jgi:hypothetical protein
MTRIAVVLLLCALVVPAAHADGDPASDYLYTQKVFVPFDVTKSPAQSAPLAADIEGATKAGFAIRVAVIGSAYDLGSVPSLWQQPRLYARFLGAELAFVYKQRLLIVMPNGFGFFWKGHPVAREYATLAKIHIARGNLALLTAARAAVQALAADANVRVQPQAVPKSTTGRDRAIIAIVALLLIAAALVGRVALRRRRG